MDALLRFFLLFSLACSPYANSATIEVIDGKYDGERYVKISGEIIKGDHLKLIPSFKNAILNGNNSLTVLLDSPGGDVEESIVIGNILRDLMVNTIVMGNDLYDPSTKEGKDLQSLANQFRQVRFNALPIKPGAQLADKLVKCYSSCVLIFYGGASHYVSDNSIFNGHKNKDIPVIGLHRPYFASQQYSKLPPDKAEQKYIELENVVRRYMKKMGVQDVVLERMLKKSSTSIDLVPMGEFEKYYQQTEPFLEEWQIQKCKAFGPSNALTQDEYIEFQQYIADQSQAIKNGKINSPKNMKNFVPEGQTKERIGYLNSKIDNYNSSSMKCREFSLINYQSKKLQTLN